MAKVLDYKITDGTEIGFLLELKDGSKNWFFSHEIASFENALGPFEPVIKSKVPLNKNLYSGDSLAYVLNPINFTKWLINVTSDIF